MAQAWCETTLQAEARDREIGEVTNLGRQKRWAACNLSFCELKVCCRCPAAWMQPKVPF